MTSTLLSFELPASLEAQAPPEARGVPRDDVRLLVARRSTEELVHARFGQLPEFLAPGDLLVVNTSATIPAALEGRGDLGEPVVVHLSTRLDEATWVVEPRRPTATATERWAGDPPPRRIAVGRDAAVELLSSYRCSDRLWVAHLRLPEPPFQWLDAHARPIRYAYVPRPWPLAAYQNVYATEPGSAEMPSAGRPFSAELILRLVAKGVGVTPVVLHTGVASLEAGETPYPERVVVPASSAGRINATHAAGGRVIAVGTTVVRAVESACDDDGLVGALDGWTDLVVTPERGVRVVDGLVTGWHEPATSHLMLLEALAGTGTVERSYAAGVASGYLWHEFGDSHLLLP